jgi:hypothetical protein
MHSRGGVADVGPGVEPGAAALVEHSLFDQVVRPEQQRLWDAQAERLGGLEVEHQPNLEG